MEIKVKKESDENSQEETVSHSSTVLDVKGKYVMTLLYVICNAKNQENTENLNLCKRAN